MRCDHHVVLEYMLVYRTKVSTHHAINGHFTYNQNETELKKCPKTIYVLT